MLARKRSLVSWIVVLSVTFSFHKLARIDATAGLQISQPWPLPCEARRSLNVLMRFILTISKSSCRVKAKCSHRALLTFFPAALLSALKMSTTSGKQPPQPVPALVHDLTSSTEQRFFVRMALLICVLLTLLHEQIWASSPTLNRRLTPLGSPSKSSPGAIGRSWPLFASADS